MNASSSEFLMSHAHLLPTSALKNAHPLAAAAVALSNGYAFVVATLASAMRPQLESPAEAATRLRMLADRYAGHQPGYAADLRAAADRATAL